MCTNSTGRRRCGQKITGKAGDIFGRLGYLATLSFVRLPNRGATHKVINTSSDDAEHKKRPKVAIRSVDPPHSRAEGEIKGVRNGEGASAHDVHKGFGFFFLACSPSVRKTAYLSSPLMCGLHIRNPLRREIQRRSGGKS